ncbi:MAG: hypothetical protein ABFC38_14360 [Methanospirillum sp.]
MTACPCLLCAGWAVEEAGTAGDPWRSVLIAVTRWAELRLRNRDEDVYDLMVAEVDHRNGADLLRAAGWCL